ncbi:serine hydrolase domain-containing protein [Microlunatus parietis]|uniref:CubicO group peptidase (Beta-lactamase class C family) n=1 Tax=Microlunatus parietis TaxID=682979 RepID=A0A7Y9LBA5_9ACTN|nr:serine hydrolase domain-containing protein [Microlunatus parietis]NYE71507.1 CubicO group peptidase (beta-lactamase class C family) [Microlunatus parietis]
MSEDPVAQVAIEERLGAHVDSGELPGLAWLLSYSDEVRTGAIGHLDPQGTLPIRTDTIFRISSMTKPITAVAALILVEEGMLSLDEPVDRLLPELADRKVLRDPAGPLHDKVPSERPVTVDDLLTFRLGWGMDFTDFSPKPFDEAWNKLGLGFGPPTPARMPDPDTWLKRLGTLPLQFQPGERWLYHVGSQVLGFLVARASGQSLAEFFAERIFEPLGMIDTGFCVPAEKLDRFGPHFAGEPGATTIFDETDGQWSTLPAFHGGGEGLVSTLADYHRFASMLRHGGELDGRRLLAEPTVAAMITNQLTGDQLARGGPAPDGSSGWGRGVGVIIRDLPDGPPAGGYGWSGGLGSTWSNAGPVTGILLTSRAWSSAGPPPVFETFESIIGTTARLE